MGPGEWGRRVGLAHERLLGVQRDLGIPDREDKTYPVDYVPRLVPAVGWEVLERGLTQRMLAINEWLRRLEGGKDEVVPGEILESSVLYDGSIPTRFGGVPNRQMGFDVVAAGSGEAGGWEYLIIEDNAKMPVGIEPMHLLRARTAEVLPESYAALGVRPLDDLMQRFGEVLRAASPREDPTIAVLTTGYDDQYFLDHNVFAREHGAILAGRREVELDRDGYLVHKESGRRIDVIYERIEDGRIYDDLPGLIESQAAGKVEAVFAPNLGIADDKGVYPFVPEMIRPTSARNPSSRTSAPTPSPSRRTAATSWTTSTSSSSRAAAAGAARTSSSPPRRPTRPSGSSAQGSRRTPSSSSPRRPWTSPPTSSARREDEGFLLRDSYADYRVHALSPDPETVWVVPGAMTRVAAPGSRLVNVSSGGVMKDTWVLR